jgi:glutamate 5-kinase
LISSGAVAAGRSDYELNKKTSDVVSKQVWSAIGQVKLMSVYFDMFAEHNIQIAQVLTTKENFGDRKHYLNMKNCISAMLDNNIIPIVNENDTIAVTELMFTDNDELSGLMSSMMNCQSLFILSNIDGVLSGHPDDENSKLISTIEADDKSLYKYISPVKSGFGRGGMLTKCNIAQKIAKQGIDVFITNGNRDNIILDIFNGKDVPYTKFKRATKKVNSIKKWLSHSETFAKGEVVINEGAVKALYNNRATSLLAIGIERINGYFEKDDIVRILDKKGDYIGIGKAQYSSTEISIGQKKPKPFIHYDYLVINNDTINN